MAIETPNGIEFSVAAKAYLCAGRYLPAAGMMFGYPSPQGPKVDVRTLSKGIFGLTVDWLQNSGYAQIWQGEAKFGFQKPPALFVRATYSEGPGFTGRFLKATHWEDTSLIDIAMRLLRRTEAPFIDLMDDVSREFVAAGILTRGGYAAHGNVWNAEWLAYLQEAWLPEVWETWQRVHARPDWQIIERNVMLAVAAEQHSDDSDSPWND